MIHLKLFNVSTFDIQTQIKPVAWRKVSSEIKSIYEIKQKFKYQRPIFP